MYNHQVNRRKQWNILYPGEPKTDADAAALAEELHISHVLARLLINRGYRDGDDARNFLGKRTENFHDPFLMTDMQVAVDATLRHLAQGSKIVIYGDYDVDGVTSVVILYLYLRALGADVSYYIPSRNGEGYGVSEGALHRLAAQGVKLLITVDTGITAVEEIALAARLGIDAVITDHHECRETLPTAAAVINPHRADCTYPFKDLAGVGVVFKFLCAMEIARCPDESPRDCVMRIAEEYADLVAIGTVADVMPICDENRLIVAYGIRQIGLMKRPGLSALIEASTGGDKGGKPNKPRKITTSYIGYTLAPRINAAGRIAEASIAAELFLTGDRRRADELAEKLCTINRERQAAENAVAEEAYARIPSDYDFVQNPVVVLSDDNWHHGIIGIVASRVTERFGCPSILISFKDNQDEHNHQIGKGSGRSISGLNLVDALAHCEDLLLKYGGHELAAGLTVSRDNLAEFISRINAYARECLTGETVTVSLEADCMLEAENISLKTAEELDLLEPYGTSNPQPAFVMTDLTVEDVVPLSQGKHTKLMLRVGDGEVAALCFSRSPALLDLYPGDSVDVLFHLEINTFQGRKSVQMNVCDIRLSSSQMLREEAERRLYTAAQMGEYADAYSVIVPEREDFAQVYTLLRREFRAGHEVFSMRALLHLLQQQHPSVTIRYPKLKFILRIFQELNLLQIEEEAPDVYHVTVNAAKGKTNLEKSSIYKKLKNHPNRQGKSG